MNIRKDKENKNLPANRTPYRIERYSPWGEIDRIFDDMRSRFFSDVLFPAWPEEKSWMSETRMPAMDVADLGDKYEMTVEMPGIPKENIDIEVTPNGLQISANYKDEKTEDDKNWLRRERSQMQFFRSMNFPEEVKTEGAEASMDHGVLKVWVPKRVPTTEEKSKKIKIK